MSEQNTPRTPVIAKVFPFISAGLMFILITLILVALIPGSNQIYTPFFSRLMQSSISIKLIELLCAVMQFFVVCGILLYGVGTAVGRKSGPSLCGVGLFILAALRFIQLVTNNLSGLSLFWSVLILAAFILTALYYALKGKSVNQLVKLIAAIVSIAVTLIMLIQSLISAIRFDIPGWVIIRWFLEDCAYTLLWISVILHSPFKKTA